jgi:patatin-like phospholipase/acyl hydrolase
MRVLAIDGGGIRGLIPALVLAELEDRSDRPVFELFDLMAGTSTGGILVSALCAPGQLPAAEVAQIYEEEGPRIFDRSIWQRIQSAEGLIDEKYDATALDQALDRFIGDKRLSAARPDLLVPTYDTAAPGPHFFKTTKARDDPADDARLADVARATSSAPTYFEPLEMGPRALLDGGVFAVNPAMSALAEVLRENPGADINLVSLGTGERTHKRPFDEIKDWGLVEWARPILDVVFDGSSDAVDYQVRHVLGDEHYWRFQTELTLASDDLDDASEENLRALRQQAEQLITERTDDLDAVVRALTA